MKYFILNAFIVVLSFNSQAQELKKIDLTKSTHVKTSKITFKSYDYDTIHLIEAVKELSSDKFEGRRTGTKGAEKARDYIINRFKAIGVKSLNESYVQDFKFEVGTKNYNAQNILAEIKGSHYPSKYIVISAHYDHEGIKQGKIYNGADDDASGVSALFAFAEYLKSHQPKHSVILAAFDGEELGLKGAYNFVKAAKENLVLNLNMDMISRSNKSELFAVGTRYTSALKPVIEANKIFGKVKLVIGHEGLTKADNWTHSSDHAAFYDKNIPFVYFGVADHEDYHKPTDDFENIDQEFFKDAVQIILNTFKEFDLLNL